MAVGACCCHPQCNSMHALLLNTRSATRTAAHPTLPPLPHPHNHTCSLHCTQLSSHPPAPPHPTRQACQAELLKLRNDISELEKEFKRLATEIDGRQASVLELQEEERKRLVRSTSARDELAKVQQELALAQAERDSAAAEKKRLDEAIQVSQACLADCEEKTAAGQVKLAEVQEQLKGQAKVAEESQAKVEKLGARLEELNREIGKKSGWLPTLFNALTPRWVGGGWVGLCVVPGGIGVLQVPCCVWDWEGDCVETVRCC